MNEVNDFEIKNKPYVLKLCIFLLIFSVVLLIGLLISKFTWLEDVGYFWIGMIIPIMFLPISIFGIYGYYKEAFIFKNGEFIYIKILKKKESVKADDVAYVIIKNVGLFFKVVFIDKNGKTAISFLDDGTAFQNSSNEENSVFIETLKTLEIPIKH